jgi:hypothetical protein
MDLSPTVWRKSHHSGTETSCVEVTTVPSWQKSPYSAEETSCVEVATVDPAAAH